jgi:hypothetical protein
VRAENSGVCVYIESRPFFSESAMTGVVKGVLARAAAAWGSEEEASAANRRCDSLGRNLMLGELTMARVGARVALAAEDVSQVARTSGTHTSRRESRRGRALHNRTGKATIKRRSATVCLELGKRRIEWGQTLGLVARFRSRRCHSWGSLVVACDLPQPAGE